MRLRFRYPPGTKPVRFSQPHLAGLSGFLATRDSSHSWYPPPRFSSDLVRANIQLEYQLATETTTRMLDDYLHDQIM